MSYGLKIETEWQKRHNEQRDFIAEIERSASGNLILRIGKENGDGSWHQIAHIALTPHEAWAFAAEAADVLPPDSVMKLAREAVEMWRAGQRMYDFEEVDAKMSELIAALPPEYVKPIAPSDDPDAPF